MEEEVFSINDLCTRVTDGSHFSPENISDGIYPMYSVKDMDYNGFKKDGYKTIDQSTYDKLCKSDCRPLKNDILIAKDGSYLKYVFKTKEDLNACILSSIAILRPNIKKIDPDYFVYLLRSASVKNSMANYVSGAALPRIILKAFKKMRIKLIKDRTYQSKIGNILSTYDDLIEKNNRKIEILREMAEELYKEWFVRFRFPGYKTAKFIDGIPEGWKETKLGNICQITTGNKDANEATGDGLYPFFTCARETTLTTNEYILDTDAILVSGNGSYTGLVKKFSGKFDLYQRTYALYDFNDVDWLYIYWVMKTDFEPKHMGGTNGAAIPYITKPVLQKYKLLVPNKDLLNEAGKIFAYCHKQCNLLEKQNNNLKQQRDLLLPRLMSGKLEVKVS